MASVKENLIAARALIDTPEKWNKTGSFGSDGCWCAIGAIEMAGGAFRDFHYMKQEWHALWAALPEEARCGNLPRAHDIFSFNDHPDTTHADIMALFDRAIAAAEAQP